MQKDDRRRVLRTSFAIENSDTINRHAMIGRCRGRRLQRSSLRRLSHDYPRRNRRGGSPRHNFCSGRPRAHEQVFRRGRPAGLGSGNTAHSFQPTSSRESTWKTTSPGWWSRTIAVLQIFRRQWRYWQIKHRERCVRAEASSTFLKILIVECREQLQCVGLRFVMIDKQLRLVCCHHPPNSIHGGD